jgi:hypothetical protein
MKADFSNELDKKLNKYDYSIKYDKTNLKLSDINDTKQLINEMKDDISKHMEKLTHKNITFND